MRRVGRVDGDAFDYLLTDVSRDVGELWSDLHEFLADVRLDDSHSVRRQRSSLIATNGSGVSHRFAGVQMTHQVVVFHHLLNRVGKREGDGEWQALGHGHDQHSHTDNEVLDQVVEVSTLPLVAFEHEGLDAELDDQNGDGQHGNGGASIPDLDGELRQLSLQHTLLLLVAAALISATTSTAWLWQGFTLVTVLSLECFQIISGSVSIVADVAVAGDLAAFT